jgi:hypothetical protein
VMVLMKSSGLALNVRIAARLSVAAALLGITFFTTSTFSLVT